MSSSEIAADEESIRRSLSSLQAYIQRERYSGYDPYDCLSSPLFTLPVLNGTKTVRWGAQQVLKRLPLNLRPVLHIRKGYNPVTLGLCLQAYSYLADLLPESRALYEKEIGFCLEELIRLQTPGYSGVCWGYDFNWEARYARIPAYTPTVVATGFITNALFQNYIITGNTTARDLCISAGKFVTNDLHKTHRDGLFCFSYSPVDRNVVLNATMKGARLLAQVYSITRVSTLLDEATATVRFVVRQQQENGAWPYSVGDSRSWADNFHTGYVLDCLDEIVQIAGGREFEPPLQKGLQFYLDHYFQNNEIPKYYDNSLFPIDTTAAAQSILTLTRFGYKERAARVALWMIRNMQHPTGYFYYQKHRLYTNRIPYMRWSNAWMFLALSYYMRLQNALV